MDSEIKKRYKNTLNYIAKETAWLKQGIKKN